MVICSCCKPLPTQSQRSLTPSFPVPKPRACARKINYHPGGKPTQLPPFVRVCVPSELNCVKRRSRSFAPCYRWMLARNISSRMAYIGPTQLPTCVHVPSQLNLVKKRKSRSFGRSSCYRRILPRIFFFLSRKKVYRRYQNRGGGQRGERAFRGRLSERAPAGRVEGSGRPCYRQGGARLVAQPFLRSPAISSPKRKQLVNSH